MSASPLNWAAHPVPSTHRVCHVKRIHPTVLKMTLTTHMPIVCSGSLVYNNTTDTHVSSTSHAIFSNRSSCTFSLGRSLSLSPCLAFRCLFVSSNSVGRVACMTLVSTQRVFCRNSEERSISFEGPKRLCVYLCSNRHDIIRLADSIFGSHFFAPPVHSVFFASYTVRLAIRFGWFGFSFPCFFFISLNFVVVVVTFSKIRYQHRRE